MITIQNILQTPYDHSFQNARKFEVNNNKYHQLNTFTKSKGSSNTNQPRIYIVEMNLELNNGER